MFHSNLLRMTDMKICENQAQSSLTYVWMFLDEMRGKGHHDSVASTAMLASLMYLLKKDALRIKHNADWETEHPFMQIDGNFIYMKDPEMLRQWNEKGYDTLDLCSALPVSDPLYEIVNRNLSYLYDMGTTKSILELMKDVVSGNIASNQFCDIIESALRFDRDVDMYSQPKEFAELAKMLLCVDGKTIFNPFSGLMSFATTFDGYSQFTGVEINREICDLAMLRLALADKLANTNLICGNIDTWTDSKYDVIVANPPFGMKMQMNDTLANGAEDSATIALRRFADTTSTDGQMFTLVNTSMLSASTHASLREELTNKNYLDAVICLPEGVLSHTSARLSVIVLKKDRATGAPVKMIDASQMFTGKKQRILCVDDIVEAYTNGSEYTLNASVEDIASKLYSWDASFYNAVASETFREGFDVLALSDILVPVRGERRFSEREGKCVKIGNLPSDWSSYVLNVSDIPVTDSLRNAQKITTPVILMSMAGKDLKVAYCEASAKSPIFIGPNVNAYEPSKTNIHVGYLCMELSKKVIPTTGIAIPHINQQSLALIKIDFPALSDSNSYEQQINLFEEGRTAMLMSKAKELGLQEVIDKMKADYINEIRSRKHDMMPHLRQLSSARKNLWYYLSHKDQFTDDEFIGGMREEVLNQEAAIESLSNLLKVFSRESQFGTPEVINLDKYLMEHYFDGDNYSVDFDTDYKALASYGFDIPEVYLNFDFSKGFKAYHEACPDYIEGLNVFIASDDLKRLCDNIVFNAIKHGFTDPSRDDYSLFIELTVDQKRDMFQIDFRNNGTPLPKGLDKLRYGLKGEKAGSTAGTGEGGYVVKSITEHYGGDYDIFCETSDNVSLTTVRVFLPIHRDNE